MRKVCIINQKGGVGKTTTSINIAAGLARAGQKVLLIDMDPQGNLSTCFGVRAKKTIYDVLLNDTTVEECLVNVGKDLDFIPSKENLTKAEMILVGEQNRERMLSKKLKEVNGYDFVIIDCPPSLGLLNQNVMLFCDEVFIPTSTDVLGLHGLANIMRAIDKVNDVFDHMLRPTKIIPTLYDMRNRVCKESLKELQSTYTSLVTQPIRVCSKLKEAPKSGTSIYSYDPKSRGAQDYRQLVNEIMHSSFDYNEMFNSAEKEKVAVEVFN